MAATPGRFEVEDGEIIDTKARQIISLDQLAKLATPEEQDSIRQQIQDSGWAGADQTESSDSPALARGTVSRPSVTNTPSQQDALPSRPSLQQFMEVAKQDNPDVPDKDLRRYWAQNYSDIDPKTLPSLETFLAAAKEDNPGVPDQALKAYWNENYGDFGAAEKDTHLGIGGTIWEGAKSAGRSLKATGQALIGDESGVVDTANAQQSAPRDIALQNLLTDIQKRKDSLGKDPSWLATIGEMGKAALSNPKGAGLLLAEQLPNSAVALGSGLAGAAAGSALGPIGTIAGGIAGLFAANTALETGGKAIEAGADQSFTPDDRSRVLKEGLTKGAVITGVDVASLGLTNFITGTTARAVERATVKTLTDAGVDVTDRAAVMAATKNPDIFSAVQSAQQRAQVASNALGQRLARGSGAVGAEAVGEGAGEYLGEYAATGEADKMEAVIEAFAGLGQSAGEIAATHGLNRKREASALLQGPAPTAIESIPNQIGVGNPTVSIEQAIVNAQDILSAPVSSTRPQEDALSSRLAQLSASTAAQREADSLESERQLQSGERLPSAQEAAMQADGIPRTGQDIPLLEGQQSSPSTLPIADPSRLWMDEAVVPGIEPGQAFTPRASSEPDAKARLQAERERLLSMRKMPSAPSDMAQPVMSETPSQSDMPIQSAADLAYPSSERGRMPTQEELALRDRGPEKRAAQQVPLIEGGEGDATSTIIPGATFSPRQEPVLTPKERLAAEREKLVRMKATRPAPMPSEPTVPPSSTPSDAPLRSAVDRAYPSVSELHDLARDKGFDVESPVFKTLTKMSTGKTHLDELSPSARDRFAETLKKLTPRETPTIVESPTKKALAPVQPGSPSSDAVTAPRSALPPEQNAEMLLRAEKANADLESSSEMQDESLIDFLKSKGGLQDQGGELSTMEVDAQRKAFSKKLIQEKGLTLDQAAELAHEAGYIQDRDIALLLDGIDKEVRGKGQHANWYRELTTGPKPMTREAIDTAVAKIIEDHGVDTGAAVERVKAALLNDGEFDGTQWGEDAASIARGDWPAWIPKPDALPQQGATPQQEPVSASPSTKGTTTTPPQSEAATAPQEEPFTLTQQAAKADKPKPKATQLSIDVPPPTVGERPIIGREVTPEEAPLFSESAKQPDAQQLDIAQEPEPVAPNAAPEVAPSPTEILASALRTAADQIEGKKAEAKIEDVGEKIGGARKDIAEKTGAKAKVQTPKDETPGWRKRFTIQQVVGSRNPSEVGKWAIHDSKKTDFAGRPRQVGNHLFDSKEEAEAAIPMYAVAMKHRVRWERDGQYAIYRNISDRKVIKVVDQTFPTEDDAKRYMIQHAEEIIELRTNFGEEILPRPDTVTRAGPDYRNGRNVTADDFRQSFDFRAVEFGNWNNQVERQEVMNHAYDGLMDLADTLNIPPKAIGLNGDLALAFGARGQGLSSAVAHYERTYGVINLTKMSGAGHLAHEWMHAADHYFGRQDTKASSEKVANERGDLVFDTNGTSDYASHGFRAAGSQVREEVRQAYTNLMKAMFKKGEQFVEDATKAQKFVGEARQEVESKLKQIRDDLGRKHDWMKRNGNPATADQLADFDAIAQRILDGELFEDKWISAPASKTKRMVMSGRWSNDAVEKVSAIYKAVRNRSGFDSQNQSGAMDKLRSSMKFYSARIKMLADAQQGTEKTKMVPTSYAMEAKAMDQGRAENYWMTEHEMLARAFAAYVEDTLKESGRNSDFITYQTFGAVPTAWGWKKPYPEGQERKDINKAFKDFFSILKTKETDQGTALFSQRPGGRTRFLSQKTDTVEDQVTGAMREALSIGSTTWRLLDTSSQYPAEVMESIARRPYVAKLARGMAETFRSIRTRLPAAYRDVQFLGISPDDYYQGVYLGNVSAGSSGGRSNVVLLNPYGILDATQANMEESHIPPELLPEQYARQLIETITHELTHRVYSHGEAGSVEDRQFEQALAANRALVHDVAEREVARWTTLLTEPLNGQLAALDEIELDRDSLRPHYVPEAGNPLGEARRRTAGRERSEPFRREASPRGRPGGGIRPEGSVPEEDRRALASRDQSVSGLSGRSTDSAGLTRDDLNSPNSPGITTTPEPSSNVPSRSRVTKDLTDAQRAALARVHGTKETWAEKLDTFKKTWKRELVQGLFDQYSPILDYSKKGYILSRMAKSGDGTLEALMLYGKPYVDSEGAYRVDYTESGGMQGFSKVLSSLQGEHDRFLEWVAAQRAGRLKSVGLENLYSEADIATLKTLNQGKMPDGASREAAYLKALSQLNEWNDAMVKIGVDSGLISDEAREQFKNVPYVPFYRLQEEGLVTGFGKKPGLVNQYAWKKLKGGTAHLNDDLLANLLQNWSHIITASAKNRAAKETLTAAKQAGVAEEIPSGAPGKGHVHYLENGKEVTFTVSDPALMDAVAALHYAGLGSIGKPFTAMKRALSFAVTVNPAYKIRNLIRDSIQAIGTSDLSYNPIKNMRQGAKATRHEAETRAQLLAGGGMMRFGSMLDGNDTTRTRRLIESGVDPETILSDAGAIEKVWKRLIQPAFQAYQEFGDRGEQMNRAALYEQLLKKGLTHQEASFWARDLMDFSMSGKWAGVRILTQIVPFMNARLQGLYKLGRASRQDYRKLATTLGAVALASIGLMLAYQDDEDWKKREDFDRENYWWFKVGSTAFRLPKPFEIGVVGTIAERSVEYLVSREMTGERFGERLAAVVFSQLSMNPTPQLVKPLMDLYANKDGFTGRPIETMGMERLRKQDRYTDRTSETAKFLGGLGLPDPAQLAMGRWNTLSPVQVDSLVRGYFSWLGSTTMTALDYGIRPMLNRGERPDMTLKEAFLVGNFAESLPNNSSRYMTQFYSQATEIEQAYNSYRDALKRGDTEGAASIMEDERDKLSQYHMVEHVKRQESKLNEQIKLIERSQRMSGEEKRSRIDELQQRKQRLVERVAERQLVAQ